MRDDSTYVSGVLMTAVIVVIFTPLFSSAANSLVQVESRESSDPSYRQPTEVERDRSGFGQQYQMQLLQQEVMQLRGVVEELQHELQRVNTVQDDRYLELDARLQQAMQAFARQSPNMPMDETEDKTQATDDSGDDNLSEKEQYETAQMLIRNRQYDQAITQLDGLIERFPDGELTPNAYYWLGQVYAAKVNPNFEQARQALTQVISYFPNHSKVPDAAYALGKVYNTLGDCQRAKDLLQQVVQRYDGKTAAKLADKYLRESIDCES